MQQCYLEHNQQLSFKYFQKSFQNSKLLSKVLKIQTTILDTILDIDGLIRSCAPTSIGAAAAAAAASVIDCETTDHMFSTH